MKIYVYKYRFREFIADTAFAGEEQEEIFISMHSPETGKVRKDAICIGILEPTEQEPK